MGIKRKKESIEKSKETFKKIEHQKGNKNSSYNTCWINNGIENKKIKKDKLQEYPDWVKGRLCIGNIGKNQYRK